MDKESVVTSEPVTFPAPSLRVFVELPRGTVTGEPVSVGVVIGIDTPLSKSSGTKPELFKADSLADQSESVAGLEDPASLRQFKPEEV